MTPEPQLLCFVCVCVCVCRGGSAAVAKTLDLIKTVLQPSLNQEVANLCDSYRRIFDMAASNINENTGDTVPSSTLQMLIVKMLEEVGGAVKLH